MIKSVFKSLPWCTIVFSFWNSFWKRPSGGHPLVIGRRFSTTMIQIQKIKYSEMKFRVFWIFRILNRSKHEYDFRRLWHQNFSNMTIWRRKPIHFPKILILIRTVSFNKNHTVHFRSRPGRRQIQRHVRVTVTFMSGITVTWAQDQILSC